MKIFMCLSFCVGMAFGVYVQSASAEGIRRPDLVISNGFTKVNGAIVCSRDDRFVAVAGSSNVVCIYKAHPGHGPDGDNPQILAGHIQPVLAIHFCGTNQLATVSIDQTARIWDIVSGRITGSVNLKMGSNAVAVFAPGDEPLLAVGTGREIDLWNYRTGERLKTFEANDSGVSALAFTPDGKRLVVGTWKGVLRVVDVALGKVVRAIDLDSPIHSLAAGRDHILVGYGDGTVAVLNFGEQTSIPELKKQSGAINALAFSPKGDRFASASADGTVKLWDAGMFKVLSTLENNGGGAFSIAFSPDGREIVASAKNGNVYRWTIMPH
jgi:WD40 repeat protein